MIKVIRSPGGYIGLMHGDEVFQLLPRPTLGPRETLVEWLSRVHPHADVDLVEERVPYSHSTILRPVDSNWDSMQKYNNLTTEHAKRCYDLEHDTICGIPKSELAKREPARGSIRRIENADRHCYPLTTVEYVSP